MDTDAAVNADPFATLSDETRLRILNTLYEQTDTIRLISGCSYLTLRDGAVVTDNRNSGYYLDMLCDQFIKKGGQEYRLTFFGFEIAKLLRANAYKELYVSIAIAARTVKKSATGFVGMAYSGVPQTRESKLEGVP